MKHWRHSFCMSGSRGDASGSIPQASFQVLTNSPPEVHQVTSTSVQSSYRLRLATQSISFLRHRFIGNGKHVHFLCRSRTVIACLPLDVETTSLLRTRCFVLRRLSEEQKKGKARPETLTMSRLLVGVSPTRHLFQPLWTRMYKFQPPSLATTNR